MTSVKLKFRPSVCPDKEGALFFQVIRHRAVRKIKSKYRIYNGEWDGDSGQIVLPAQASSRHSLLLVVRLGVEWELRTLQCIVSECDRTGGEYGVDDVVARYESSVSSGAGVFGFIRELIAGKKLLGKIRSSETYQATLNSFMRFRHGIDLSFGMMDAGLMELYETELRSRGLARNTTSFYMRILRTIYRQAVERGLTEDRHPFKHVYCGMDKTLKRCLSLAEVKRLKGLDLSSMPTLDFARDMFIFSFCTRGMSFVDMAYLKKGDLKNGYLTYQRRKTGQRLTIEWTRQMQDILDKRGPTTTQYLLPIILREDGSERRQYQNQMMKINRRLKDVARLARLKAPLSLYYSRHSWATIARGKDVPLSVISEGLGHDSEITTQIYLDSIRSSEVDKANRRILKDL